MFECSNSIIADFRENVNAFFIFNKNKSGLKGLENHQATVLKSSRLLFAIGDFFILIFKFCVCFTARNMTVELLKLLVTVTPCQIVCVPIKKFFAFQVNHFQSSGRNSPFSTISSRGSLLSIPFLSLTKFIATSIISAARSASDSVKNP